MQSPTSRFVPLALSLALAALPAGPARAAPSERVEPGDPVPDLKLTDQAGAPVDLGAPDDRVHLLLFVRGEHKYEQLAAKDLHDLAGVLGASALLPHVVWVAPEEETPTSDLGLGCELWFDQERKAVEMLGIIVYPTTLLISKDRKILKRVPSRPPNYAKLIENAVKLELGLIDEQEIERLQSEQAEAHQNGSDHSKARLLASFAQKLAHDGKLEQAAMDFARAMKLAGDDLQVVLPYAAFLLDLGEAAEAARLVDRFLEQAPNHSGLRVIRARILAKEGRLEEAASLLEEVLPLTPDKAPVLFELGKLRAAQEQWQAAAELYREALQLLLDERHP